jgi:broad specificity phosphatase PhoE
MKEHLILIRHGQTEWNATGRWQGQADPPLNDTGRAQARQTALELRALKLDELISSDLRRARETAEIIVEPRLCVPYLIDSLVLDVRVSRDSGKAWEIGSCQIAFWRLEWRQCLTHLHSLNPMQEDRPCNCSLF